LEWKQLCNLPIKLQFPQAVAVGDEVYVGGLIPEGEDGKDATYIIFNYSSLRNEWNLVATPPVLMGGLAAFSGRLVSVGGRRRNEASNAVYVFDDKSRKWKESIPRLHKHRMLPSCASYHSLLVACGGAYIRQARTLSNLLGTSTERISSWLRRARRVIVQRDVGPKFNRSDHR